MNKKLKGFVFQPKGETRDTFFTPRAVSALSENVDLTFIDTASRVTKEMLISEIRGKGYNILFSGWGTMPIDADILDAAPELKMIAYDGGSVAGVATEALYDRGVKLICGNKVFAMSVAEATVCYMMAAPAGSKPASPKYAAAAGAAPSPTIPACFTRRSASSATERSASWLPST